MQKIMQNVIRFLLVLGIGMPAVVLGQGVNVGEVSPNPVYEGVVKVEREFQLPGADNIYYDGSFDRRADAGEKWDTAPYDNSDGRRSFTVERPTTLLLTSYPDWYWNDDGGGVFRPGGRPWPERFRGLILWEKVTGETNRVLYSSTYLEGSLLNHRTNDQGITLNLDPGVYFFESGYPLDWTLIHYEKSAETYANIPISLRLTSEFTWNFGGVPQDIETLRLAIGSSLEVGPHITDVLGYPNELPTFRNFSLTDNIVRGGTNNWYYVATGTTEEDVDEAYQKFE